MKKKRRFNPYAMAKAEAFGAYPESLVNAAAAEGLEIRNIQRINQNTLSFDIYEHELDTFKHLSAKC